ncbi:MAG TPA: hypothetical protein VK563_22380 [Puia sp.]|nr:hypothetical protein [Puia sp.]
MCKKKRLFFFTLCIFFNSYAFSEIRTISDSSSDSASIYYKSLKLHLDYVERYLTDGPLPPSGYWNIDMEIPSQLSGQLPGQLGHFRISYLNKKEIRARIKRHRSMYLIRMGQAVVRDGFRIVGIGNFNITSRRRKLWYGNSGGTTAKFKYDDACDSFVLVDLQQGSL